MVALAPRHRLTQHSLRCATVFGASQNAGDLARGLACGAVLQTDSGFFRFRDRVIDHSQSVTNSGFVTAKFDDLSEFGNVLVQRRIAWSEEHHAVNFFEHRCIALAQVGITHHA